MAVRIVLTVLCGYVIGAIPMGFIAGRLHGTDIRQFGSGNIGATNTLRVLGPAWGGAVFLLDAGKGVAACHLASVIAGGPDATLIALGGLMAIAGHNWSVFLRFQGGKGAATTAGAFGYMSPFAVACGLAAAFVAAAVTKYMSLGSLLGMLVGVVVGWLLGIAFPYRIAMVVALLWGLWRHRGNIGRLLRGEERKLGQAESSSGKEPDDR